MKNKLRLGRVVIVGLIAGFLAIGALYLLQQRPQGTPMPTLAGFVETDRASYYCVEFVPGDTRVAVRAVYENSEGELASAWTFREPKEGESIEATAAAALGQKPSVIGIVDAQGKVTIYIDKDSDGYVDVTGDYYAMVEAGTWQGACRASNQK